MFRPRETKGLCTPHIHSLLSPSKKKKSKQQLTKKITVVGKLRKKKEKKEFNQSINQSFYSKVGVLAAWNNHRG